MIFNTIYKEIPITISLLVHSPGELLPSPGVRRLLSVVCRL